MSREVCRHCESCGEWAWGKDTTNECPLCKGPIYKPTAGKGYGMQVIPDMKPYLSENMGNDPVWIRSRAHWKEELKKRGLFCKEA